MHELKARLAQELPHIEKALSDVCSGLPPAVRPVAQHIFSAGGKRLRPFLTILVARLFSYANQDLYSLAVSMEMLHAATLLHDDVLDDALVRRGHPAAHTLFDVTSTILAGDALLASANTLVSTFDDIRLCRCFSEATLRTANGEILEIQYMHRLDQGPEIYNEIVLGKTAWLLRASCFLGALRAGASEQELEAVGTYGQELGIAFQIVDDALDFAPESLTGKPSGGDILEGKLTPPIRLYREQLSPAERDAFDAAFTQGTFTKDDAARMGTEICRKGFDTHTRHMAGEALHRARQALHALPQGDENIILRQMTDFVQNRQK